MCVKKTLIDIMMFQQPDGGQLDDVNGMNWQIIRSCDVHPNQSYLVGMVQHGNSHRQPTAVINEADVGRWILARAQTQSIVPNGAGYSGSKSLATG